MFTCSHVCLHFLHCCLCLSILEFYSFVFFFFQAEDGIRDIGVTGVQTCALPISPMPQAARPWGLPASHSASQSFSPCSTGTYSSHPRSPTYEMREARTRTVPTRSEERRVGKECRCGGWPNHARKKKT